VIYRSEDDPSRVWARPLVNFLSPVDRMKYPDSVQNMRFEKVEDGAGRASGTGYKPAKAAPAESSIYGLDPEVEAFLDAKSSSERLLILSSLNHRLTDEMLITMATAVDVELPEGDINTKYQSLRESLVILGKYEGDRLR
jgi:hypothetical protein